MSAVASILSELEKMGTAQTKKTWLNHGAREPIYGVKVQDMKTIQKRIKKDYLLSLDLYRSGVGDAMYLAGLISDPMKMTKEDLQEWADQASWAMVSEYTVPWAASESRFGRELALTWIDDADPRLRATGWNTYGAVLSLKKDEELDIKEIESLLNRIIKEIHGEEERVKYTMNNFVIATGTYVAPLLAKAKATAVKMGVVTVDMGNTECKVPGALPYIEKAEAAGKVGKKKKTVFC